MARSIIIEDILPTKWRLRLRDGAGKTREVDFKSGTPLRLDVNDKVAAIDASAKKSAKRTEAEPKAESRPHAESKHRPHDKEKSATRDDAPQRAPTEEAPPKPESEEAPARPRRRKPEPGKGPGDLAWEESEDDGVPGLRASFERGAFKILQAGGDVFALFYEWNNGKYQTLACGPLETLKESVAQWQGEGKLKAPRSQLGAEAAKVACTPKEAEPPSPPADAPASEMIEPAKDKAIMDGFEATLQKVMAARAAAGKGDT